MDQLLLRAVEYLMSILAHGKTRYPESIKQEARTLYAHGMKCAHIANKMNISLYLIRRWCDDDYRRQQNDMAKLKRQKATK